MIGDRLSKVTDAFAKYEWAKGRADRARLDLVQLDLEAKEAELEWLKLCNEFVERKDGEKA